MPKVDAGGIKGESYKEVWGPPVIIAEQRRRHEEFMESVPAEMRKGMPEPEFRAPWMSLGVAPSQDNLDDEAYGGSA